MVKHMIEIGDTKLMISRVVLTKRWRDIIKHITYDIIREISLKHQHSVCGLFEQGSGQRELGEAAALHPWL
jgi:hypothetical protein